MPRSKQQGRYFCPGSWLLRSTLLLLCHHFIAWVKKWKVTQMTIERDRKLWKRDKSCHTSMFYFPSSWFVLLCTQLLPPYSLQFTLSSNGVSNCFWTWAKWSACSGWEQEHKQEQSGPVLSWWLGWTNLGSQSFGSSEKYELSMRQMGNRNGDMLRPGKKSKAEREEILLWQATPKITFQDAVCYHVWRFSCRNKSLF